MEDISHREIYDKLVAVETKVDTISKDTKDVVNAFNSAKGAFLVFEWIGKLATETGAYPLMVKIKEQAEAQVPKQDEVKSV